MTEFTTAMRVGDPIFVDATIYCPAMGAYSSSRVLPMLVLHIQDLGEQAGAKAAKLRLEPLMDHPWVDSLAFLYETDGLYSHADAVREWWGICTTGRIPEGARVHVTVNVPASLFRAMKRARERYGGFRDESMSDFSDDSDSDDEPESDEERKRMDAQTRAIREALVDPEIAFRVLHTSEGTTLRSRHIARHTKEISI